MLGYDSLKRGALPMRSSRGCCVVGLLAVMLCHPQQKRGLGEIPPPSSPNESQERQLQWAHEQNLEDTSRLAKLSQELKWDLAYHDREVLSLATVKKMDEIERLIKRIRARVGKK
jgi:hypothetical protein